MHHQRSWGGGPSRDPNLPTNLPFTPSLLYEVLQVHQSDPQGRKQEKNAPPEEHMYLPQ